MNPKWILAAIVVCLLAGFAAGSLLWTSSAQGQLPAKGPAWEFKVELFYGGDGPKECNQKLNALAADGWEYTGLVHMNEQRHESTVAFKRAKR